jgi:hypothetical protein
VNGGGSGGGRAPVFGDGGELDLSGFEPRPPARPEQVRGVAEQAGFRSREPAVSTSSPSGAARREARRYRTGRNVQLNIKARAEDIEAFYRIADSTGLVLGEVFARAIAALDRELSGSSQTATK